MANKTSAYAKKSLQNRQLWMDGQRLFTMQYCADLWSIVLHREFGFGSERCNKALKAFAELYDELRADALDEDGFDKDLTVTRAAIDGMLGEIFGDKVMPWSERYDFMQDVRKVIDRKWTGKVSRG